MKIINFSGCQMRNRFIAGMFTALLTLASSGNLNAAVFTYSSGLSSITTGISPSATSALINFAGNGTAAGGGTFTFDNDPTSGYDFAFGGNPIFLQGLKGNIGGTFTIGAISGGAIQTAFVTDLLPTFTIDDGAGFLLSGDLDIIDITTIGNTGILNINSAVNLSSISYAGFRPDLLFLVDANAPPGATVTFSFSFTSPMSLSTLSGNGSPITDTYAGRLSASSSEGLIELVPEPASMAIWGIGALGLAVAGMRRKKLVG